MSYDVQLDHVLQRDQQLLAVRPKPRVAAAAVSIRWRLAPAFLLLLSRSAAAARRGVATGEEERGCQHVSRDGPDGADVDPDVLAELLQNLNMCQQHVSTCVSTCR